MLAYTGQFTLTLLLGGDQVCIGRDTKEYPRENYAGVQRDLEREERGKAKKRGRKMIDHG